MKRKYDPHCNDDDSSSWFGMPAPLDVAANAVGAATTSLVQSHSETEVKQKESALRGKIMQLQAVLELDDWVPPPSRAPTPEEDPW